MSTKVYELYYYGTFGTQRRFRITESFNKRLNVKELINDYRARLMGDEVAISILETSQTPSHSEITCSCNKDFSLEGKEYVIIMIIFGSSTFYRLLMPA